MKQVMIQLDDATAAQLEKVAPGSSRKRSEFLRGVIARALHETLELRTRKAYEEWPDQPANTGPDEWADENEAVHPRAKPRATKRAQAATRARAVKRRKKAAK